MNATDAKETIKTAQALIEWDYPITYAAAFDVAIKYIEILESIIEQIKSRKQDIQNGMKRNLMQQMKLASSDYQAGYLNALSDVEKLIMELESKDGGEEGTGK